MRWKQLRHQRKRIASKHIKRMLELAFKNLEDKPERSRRYVRIAKDIVKKHKVQLTSDQKRQFCKKCNMPLVPGRTARVRTSSGMVSITCLHCGNIKRFPFRREVKARRSGVSYAEKKFPGALFVQTWCIKRELSFL
jgi:ribonuclease P protein subunit RPR2